MEDRRSGPRSHPTRARGRATLQSWPRQEEQRKDWGLTSEASPSTTVDFMQDVIRGLHRVDDSPHIVRSSVRSPHRRDSSHHSNYRGRSVSPVHKRDAPSDWSDHHDRRVSPPREEQYAAKLQHRSVELRRVVDHRRPMLGDRFREEYERPLKIDENITIDIRRKVHGPPSYTINRQFNPDNVVIVRRKDEGLKPLFAREELREALKASSEEETRVIKVVRSHKTTAPHHSPEEKYRSISGDYPREGRIPQRDEPDRDYFHMEVRMPVATRQRSPDLRRDDHRMETRRSPPRSADRRWTSDARDRREIDARDRREIDTRDRREIDARDRREIDTRDRREIDMRDRREIDMRDRREIDTRDRREVEHNRERRVQDSRGEYVSDLRFSLNRRRDGDNPRDVRKVSDSRDVRNPRSSVRDRLGQPRGVSPVRSRPTRGRTLPDFSRRPDKFQTEEWMIKPELVPKGSNYYEHDNRGEEDYWARPGRGRGRGRGGFRGRGRGRGSRSGFRDRDDIRSSGGKWKHDKFREEEGEAEDNKPTSTTEK